MDIFDVDFRYVMRAIQVPDAPEGICRMTPVLQWRKKCIKHRFPECVVAGDWEAWQDVRTEEE